jgi:acyl-CoA reductase-like NAD-dependent aldehyde dehydrogenase
MASPIKAEKVSSPPDLAMLIGGTWRAGTQFREIRDPYRGDVVARAPESNAADFEAAMAAAEKAKPVMAAMPGFERAKILRKVGQLLEQRVEDVAQILSRESGKAIKDARAEIARSADTISLSAEEAIRIEGEHIPLDGSAMGAGKIAFMMRFPVGIVAGITPFNAPFNLAAHKIAPSFAAGNATILKAPPQTPYTVHKLIEMFADAGVPAGSVNSLYGDTAGPALAADPRVDFISFTGSTRAGARIKAASGLRRLTLELGGNGVTIVCADADIEAAAVACARNSMRIGGQSCISVQNVYVHRSIAEAFIARVVAEVKTIKLGDPLDPATDLGTLIDEGAARRVESWVEEAVAGGARLWSGGRRHGAAFEATVLTDVTPTMKVVCDEVFGPVVSILVFDDVEAVFDTVSNGRFGLQTGIFTKSNELSIRAFRRLRTGGVIINGTSTWRTDQLAYGGVKDSGIGREGPRYAIRDLTEERLMLFNM